MSTHSQSIKPIYLVTGASGISGSIVVNEFIKQHIPVRILVRDRKKVAALENRPTVEIHEGDMSDDSTLTGLFDGIEKALLISSSDEKMVETQQSFIDSAKKAGLPHLIKYSGYDTGIGFSGQNFIAQAQHAKAEDHLVDVGINWTILRIAQFMQFYLPGAPTGVTLEKNALILPIEDGKLAPVDIEDVAKICVGVMTSSGHERKIYEISGPDAMTMDEACEIITRVTGRKIDYQRIPLEEYTHILVAMGISEYSKQVITTLSKERRKCIDSHIWTDTHRLLNVRPTNFAEFIYKHKHVFTN